MTVDGETISDAEVFIGYNHRGVEKSAQERNFVQMLVLAERVCGIRARSHSLVYAMRKEHIADIYDQAAAWPEREINELMPISFEGLNCEQRLFLPDNLLDGKGQIFVTPLNELREKNGL